MKQTQLILIILAALLLIGGCSAAPAAQAESALPEPTATMSPTPEPTPEPTPSPTPEPTLSPKEMDIITYHGDEAFYFTEEREIVMQDMENGWWRYYSPTLYVDIHRVFDEERTITYYAAEIRVLPGETERSGFANPDRPGRGWEPVYEIQRMFQSVIAVNGDYMVSCDVDNKGIIIRDGEIFLDRDNADTLAFYPDGSLRTFAPDEITGEQLLEDGVMNTYSFGPTLVKNSNAVEGLDKVRLRSANPRTAVGMIGPYHYLLVMVEGRDKGVSVGMTMSELADLFVSYDCELAYNLDGGRSATMSFMGENISRYKSDLYGQRSVPDALMFGFSPTLAPEEETE